MLPSGRLVATARTLLDWSQEDLAKRSGVSCRTLSVYEASSDAAPQGAKIENREIPTS